MNKRKKVSLSVIVVAAVAVSVVWIANPAVQDFGRGFLDAVLLR